MRWRNGEHGYGAVTKALHWGTVALLVAQFAVGYAMDADDGGRGRGRGRGRGEESGRGRGRGGDEASYDLLDAPFGLVELHLALAGAILVVALARVVWRRATPLPPWSPRLGERDRRLLGAVERALLVLLFVIPATGVALVLGGDDLLWLHVGAHVAFFLALAVHVGLVVRRRVTGRMLPGAPLSGR
ncbi:cytochrome b/b6 domain-containing protein [Nocardioides panacisoli]|uniref:cytochrome b n=1 Tax=Nocardioides panacisoli TaxID=627624 RepID=UPI001C632B2E|nr:cytochrome b/b6 domain-containing protein [Nocardioides panacisoli]QYJ04944.1 cytochrome b/b6 domain-containing protein [Nocardioides panacisoli]